MKIDPYQIAKQELGVHETSGSAATQRIIEYHATTTLKATSDEVSWCSSFVNWCVVQAGLRGTNSAAARSWLNWGHVVADPKEGDIVVFKRGAPPSGHVSFFVRSDGGTLYCLGGNQSDQVKISGYAKADVLGYRSANP